MKRPNQDVRASQRLHRNEVPSAYVTMRPDPGSVYRREITWNIRHLANPNKLDHLTVVNRRLGLLMPQIVTPETLWLEEPS